MDTKISQEKILQFFRKFPEFLRNKIIVFLLVILLVAIFLDVFVYYEYVYIAGKTVPEVSVREAKIPATRFDTVLKEIERRSESFDKISDQPPNAKNIFK